MKKKQLKIQRATGAAVELHQFDNIKWHDHEWPIKDFDEAKNCLKQALSFSQDCADELLDDSFDQAKIFVNSLKVEDVFDKYGAVIIVEGAELAYRIVEA